MARIQLDKVFKAYGDHPPVIRDVNLDIGESEFTCSQIGHEFRGQIQARATPNPNFRRVDAVVRDANGLVMATITTILGRY